MSSSSVAVCLSNNHWGYNSRGQSPCTVATELARTCVNDFRLPPLETGFVYLGPTASAANACRCSSVYYSLLSACADCQDRNFVRWSRYNFNCTEVYVEQFPNPIPNGVAIPHWAYLDITDEDNFNITRAQAATGAESLAPSSGASSTSVPGGGSGNDENKTNVGAIAGGVIGGVVFLALVGLLIFFFIRRRNKNKSPPSAMYTPAQQPLTTGPSTTYSYGDGTFASVPTPRVYDPNDPSTWPTHQNAPHQNTGTPPPANPYQQPYNNNATFAPQATGQSGSTGYTGYAQPNQPTPPAGRYTGAPEL